MSTAEKKVVKFLKGWRGYNTGEVAGFDPDVADTLIDGGVATEQDGAEAAGTPGTGKRRRARAQAGDGEGAGNPVVTDPVTTPPGTPADPAAQGAGTAPTGNSERP